MCFVLLAGLRTFDVWSWYSTGFCGFVVRVFCRFGVIVGVYGLEVVAGGFRSFSGILLFRALVFLGFSFVWFVWNSFCCVLVL